MAAGFEEQQLSEFFDGVYDMIIASRASNVYNERDDGFQRIGPEVASTLRPTSRGEASLEASESE